MDELPKWLAGNMFRDRFLETQKTPPTGRMRCDTSRWRARANQGAILDRKARKNRAMAGSSARYAAEWSM